MSDAVTLGSILVLAMSCMCLSFVVALLSATVPFMWWQLLRMYGRIDASEAQAAQAAKDVAQLDDLVDRLCKAANLER